MEQPFYFYAGGGGGIKDYFGPGFFFLRALEPGFLFFALYVP